MNYKRLYLYSIIIPSIAFCMEESFISSSWKKQDTYKSGKYDDVSDFQFNPKDGDEIVIAWNSKKVDIIDTKSKNRTERKYPFKDSVKCFNLSPDGSAIAFGGYGKVYIVPKDMEKETAHIQDGSQKCISSLCYNESNSNLIAFASAEGAPKLWHTNQAKGQLTVLQGKKDNCLTDITAALFSPTEKNILVVTAKRIIKAWDVGTEQEIYSCPLAEDVAYVVPPAFHPQGKHFFTSLYDYKHKANIHKRETGSGKCLALIPVKDNDHIQSIVVTPDGNSLIVATKASLQLIDLRKNKVQEELFAYEGSFECISSIRHNNYLRISNDGNSFITKEYRNAVSLWKKDQD